MHFKPFSSLMARNLDSKLPILRIRKFSHWKNENLKIGDIATNFSVWNLENGAKVVRHLLNEILLAL